MPTPSPALTAGAGRLAARTAVALAAVVALVAGGDVARSQRPMSGPPVLTADTERVELLRCVGYETLAIRVENRSPEPMYADVFVSADAPLQVSRDVLSTYLPVGYQVDLPLRVDVPPDTPPGSYSLLAVSGGRRGAELTVPVTVEVPADEDCVPGPRMTAAATSFQTRYGPELAIDGDPGTFWHSQFSPALPLPQAITLDLGGVYDLTGLRVRPRGDGNPTGNITGWTISTSTDGTTFTPAASGTWSGAPTTEVPRFDAPGARAMRLEATAGVGHLAAVAELVPLGRPVDVPAVTATSLEAPEVVSAGRASDVGVVVRNWSPESRDVAAEVDVPAGWSSGPVATTVPGGEERTVPVPVTPPAGLPPAGPAADVVLTGRVSASEGGVAGAPTATTWVAPDPSAAAVAVDAGLETSPVADGWTPLTPADTWEDGDVAGWIGAVPEARDRRALDPLRRDFVLARGRAGTLRVAVPAGVHEVALLRGDATGSSGSTVVEVDGQTVVTGGGSLTAGAFAWERFTLDGGAAGRTVDVTLRNDDGNYWRLVALVFAPAAP